MTLAEIIERLEKATGSDRIIDVEMFKLFGLVDEDHCSSWCSQGGRADLTREMYIDAWARDYTASLGDTVALCERVLPRRIKHIFQTALDLWWTDREYRADELPRFVCLALLRALAAQQGQGHE